jgi:DNA polymerase-3 subunit beta
LRVQVKSAALIEAVETVKKAIAKRTTLPITTTILMVAEGNTLTLSGTDLESRLEVAIKAKVGQSGGCCVDPKILAIKTDETTVELSAKPHEGSKERMDFTYQAGKTEVEVEGRPASNFPPLNILQNPEPFSFKGIVTAFKTVLHAAACDDSRPVLTGAYIHQDKSKVKIATADGFRLAVAEITGKMPREVILTHRVMELVTQLFPENVKGEVEGGKVGPLMKFTSGDMTLYCTTIIGNFPNYQQLIPKPKGALKLRVNSADLLKTVKTLPFLKDISILRLYKKSSARELTLRASVIGEDEAKIKTTMPAGGAIMIAVNPKYLIDFLGGVEGEITIETWAQSRPMVIRTPGYMEMIMPMFVRWDEANIYPKPPPPPPVVEAPKPEPEPQVTSG